MANHVNYARTLLSTQSLVKPHSRRQVLFGNRELFSRFAILQLSLRCWPLHKNQLLRRSLIPGSRMQNNAQDGCTRE
jgi:hypothetical protein